MRGNLMFGCDTDLAFRNAARRMAGFLLPVILLSTAGVACSSPPDKPGADLPADVVAFMARRDQCDHYRGEDPGQDTTRAAKLERNLVQTCKGTDASLKALRRRYGSDPGVTAALAHYEDDVE